MKKWYLVFSLLFLAYPAFGKEALKKAFSEGIKASVDVLKYERAQTDKEIPSGYCVAIMGKNKPLDIWEEVKLESLALFLSLKPSLLISKNHSERVLCLSIKQKREDALKALKQIAKSYPNLDEYISKVEILPSKTMHRIIPGVGMFVAESKQTTVGKDKREKVDIPLSGRVVMLDSNKKSKVMFESGSTRVIATALKNILYIEHTVYHRKVQ